MFLRQCASVVRRVRSLHQIKQCCYYSSQHFVQINRQPFNFANQCRNYCKPSSKGEVRIPGFDLINNPVFK